MAYIKYYIDKPYADDISKQNLKVIIDQHDKLGKPYPKNIFNPRLTAVYLFFTYEKNQRIKAKTLLKTFAGDWDFKNGRIKNKVTIAFDTNLELQTLFNRNFENLCKDKTGKFNQPKFQYMSSHMARRTFVTIMIEKGVPLTIIQKITQHADIRTLVRYEGHSESSLIEAFKNTN